MYDRYITVITLVKRPINQLISREPRVAVLERHCETVLVANFKGQNTFSEVGALGE